MHIFVSYSSVDLVLVQQMVKAIQPFGSTFYWDRDKEIGQSDWDTIFNEITRSDIVVCLITDNTVIRAMAVGNEIGYAMNKGKLIIPIVSGNVSESQLGCLKGVTYARLDQDNPEPALQQLSKTMQTKKSKEELGNLFALGAVVIGTLWALNSNK